MTRPCCTAPTGDIGYGVSAGRRPEGARWLAWQELRTSGAGDTGEPHDLDLVREALEDLSRGVALHG